MTGRCVYIKFRTGPAIFIIFSCTNENTFSIKATVDLEVGTNILTIKIFILPYVPFKKRTVTLLNIYKTFG